MILVLVLAAVPTLEVAVERAGAPDAALLVRVHNPAGHRPIGFLREFWKFENIQCTLTRDGTMVPLKLALKPDRPTLAQLVVLAPNSDYGERLPLSDVWGTLQSGNYHAECRVGSKAGVGEPGKLFEASIAGGAKRALIGLMQDLRRVDFGLADLKPASVDFKQP
jgi:hypothetical protein